MQKPRLTDRTALTNAEKQAAWRKRRKAKIEALEKENARLKRENASLKVGADGKRP